MSIDDFETHYARVRSPLPVIKMDLNAAMARTVLSIMDPGRAEDFVIQIAKSNDIDSLQVLLASDALKPPFHERPGITYAVAHMLVDGSGNEEFAKAWLARFEHSEETAADFIRTLYRTDTLSQQQRLGMATLTDFFLRPKHQTDTHFDAMMKPAASKISLQNQSRHLAIILRALYPDDLPQIHRVDDTHKLALVPLGQVISCDSMGFRASTTSTYTHTLPAVLEAYGTDNQRVFATMQGAMDKMVDDGKLSLEGKVGENFQWNAMAIWGGGGLDRKIMNAKAISNRLMLDVLSEASSELFITRVDQLLGMGLDINTQGKASSGKRRLIELVVDSAKPEQVRFLLARGCDPMLPIHDKPETSAAQNAMKKPESDPDTWTVEAVDQVASLMRTHLSKKSALDAIAELELPRSPKP